MLGIHYFIVTFEHKSTFSAVKSVCKAENILTPIEDSWHFSRGLYGNIES